MKNKRSLHKSRMWLVLMPSILALVVCSGLIYYFSDSTLVQALTCSGNYYYTSQQIYQIAGIGVNKRSLVMPASLIASHLEEDPLIASASVSKDGRSLVVDVQEKTIIGYLATDDSNELITTDNERISVDNEMMLRTLVHYPLIQDLSEDQISQLCEMARKYPDALNREVFEKIAEILPWSESYDKNMVKLVMQDGNTIFSSISSLFMIERYQEILPDLLGENVCLVLDGTNGVINKIACDYMYADAEERAQNQAIPKSVLNISNPSSSTSTDKDKTDTSSDSKDTEENSDGEESGNTDQSEEQTEEVQEADPVTTADDWQESDYSWLYYSPSTNVYKSIYGDVYYTYNDQIGAFEEYTVQGQ